MTDPITRHTELTQLLRERRRQLQEEVRANIREGRTDHTKEVGDLVEESDAHIQGDLDFALLQMRAETLERVDEALLQLDRGLYGVCVECGEAIAERRLRAMPFAVRCQSCETRREEAAAPEHLRTQRQDGQSLFRESLAL